MLKLAKSGQIVETPEDILRNPFVLELLKMPEPLNWHESHLEERLISQRQQFLLELGKGFAFIGYQLYLPERAELEQKLKSILSDQEAGLLDAG